MYKLAWITLLTFLFISCDNKNPVDPNINGSRGQLSFSIDMTQAPDDVASLQGVLSRVDHDTVFFDFEMRDAEAVAEVEGLISGTWLLRVNALDEDGHIIYSGSTDVTVVSGQTTVVYLNLEPTTGNLKIIVTWGGHLSSVAYFPFDNSVKDKSENENNGTNFGAHFVEGMWGGSVQFDGEDDYVKIPHHDIFNADAKTISFWFYKENNHIKDTPGFDDVEGLVFKSWDTGLNRSFSFAIKNQEPPFDLKFHTGNGSDSLLLTMAKAAILPQKWYHVAGSLNKDTMSLYLNGKLVARTPFSGKIIHNDSPIVLGMATGNSRKTRYFNGKIDELYIFDYSFSEDMVESLYKLNK
jgi:Concanavalin A-like lectin/glucanases superfamily